MPDVRRFLQGVRPNDAQLDLLAVRVEHLANVVRTARIEQPTGRFEPVYGVGVNTEGNHVYGVLDVKTGHDGGAIRGAVPELPAPPSVGWGDLAWLEFRNGSPATATANIADPVAAVGTWGAAVNSRHGMSILTAGHVHGAAGGHTTLSGGKVWEWVDPLTGKHGHGGVAAGAAAKYSSGELLADIAMVHFPVSPTNGGLKTPITGTYAVTAGDPVTCHTQNNVLVHDSVNRWRQWCHLNDPRGVAAVGYHGGCFITMGAPTGPGDSGAMVTFNAGTPAQASTTVVGHVVGLEIVNGVHQHTVVQSIYWQLAVLRCSVALV